VPEQESLNSDGTQTENTVMAAAVSPRSDGIVTALAELPHAAHLDIRALAKILGRSVRSVERAIRRDELPPPIRFMGKRIWLVGTITEHMAARQQAALRLVERRDLRRGSGG